MLSILKTLNFSLVAEALTGLIYHRPAGENSTFHFIFPQLQRLRDYNIMLLAISLFTTSKESPLSIKNIYKVHSCEKSNIIPFGYLS